MKILYLAFVRMPTEKAHGAQIMKTCEALSDAGASVTLAVPNRKTPISEDAYQYYGVRSVFETIRLGVPDLVFWGPLGFLVSALWFSERAKFLKLFWEVDVIYSRDAFVLLQYVLLGRKLVYEAHTKPTAISLFVAKRAYKVVVISEGLRDAYVARGVEEQKICVAHDGIDLGVFTQKFDQHEVRTKYGVPDGKVALYVGRIDRGKGAEVLAAASMYTGYQIVLVGPGPLKGVLSRKYPHVQFLDPTPYKDLPEVLSMGDVLVLPNVGDEVNASTYTSPLKAFAYLAAGKPIVASNVPALQAVLPGDTTFVSPNDPEALGRGIDAHGAAPNLSFVEQYTWQARAVRIMNCLV